MSSKGPTKAKPFNLHEPKKTTGEEFVSRAELDMQYWKKTPQRFRSKPLTGNGIVCFTIVNLK